MTTMYLMGYGPVNVEHIQVPRPVIKTVEGQKIETVKMRAVNVCYTRPLPGNKPVRQELLDDRFIPMDEIYLRGALEALCKSPIRRIHMDHNQRKSYTDKVNGSIEEVAETLSDLAEVRGIQALQLREKARHILLRTVGYMATGKVEPDDLEVKRAVRNLRVDHVVRRIYGKIRPSPRKDASKAA